jgi:hypothetical protein
MIHNEPTNTAPTTLPAAKKAGYLYIMRHNGDDLLYTRYKEVCAETDIPAIVVSARTHYAVIIVTVEDGRELPQDFLMLSLRALNRYAKPGWPRGFVRIDRVVLEYVPIADAQCLAMQMAQISKATQPHHD